jgi:hypothetical protein
MSRTRVVPLRSRRAQHVVRRAAGGTKPSSSQPGTAGVNPWALPGYPGSGAIALALRLHSQHAAPAVMIVAAPNHSPHKLTRAPPPLAAVSTLPEGQQAAAFAAIAAGIGAGAALTAGVLGPAVSAVLPSFLQVTAKSWCGVHNTHSAAGGGVAAAASPP